MKRITVFCGSSKGYDKEYATQAYFLGQLLAENNIDLVYGGTDVGLMGIIANSVLEGGREVIGVIPDFIKEFKLAHNNLTKLIVVKSMHARKAKMSELSDAFIALPGGFGTLEELFEVLTMSQLSLHTKPVALLNVNGYYDDLLLMMRSMVEKGFLQQVNMDMLIVSDNIETLISKIKIYKTPITKKWEIN